MTAKKVKSADTMSEATSAASTKRSAKSPKTKNATTAGENWRPSLYFAAALFATRECIYNIELA